MKFLNNRNSCLLLDRNYMPLSVIGWKRALKLLIKNKVEPASDKLIKSFNKIVIPSIIKLINPIKFNSFMNKNKIAFSRKNIIIRDKSKCQYCNKYLNKSKKSLTIDHIIPESRGGKTSYSNCVVACEKCNSLKGNHTPNEVGMKLLRIPKVPDLLFLQYSNNDFPEEWNDFIKINPQE